MGLSYPVLKGVLKRGYKVPTPIQRKVRLIDKFYEILKKISFSLTCYLQFLFSPHFSPIKLYQKIESRMQIKNTDDIFLKNLTF